MRRFWVVLHAITAFTHLTFALGASFAARRLGVPWPGLVAVVIAVGLGSLMRGRVRRGGADRPIPRWRLLLIEEPYFIHWCAALAGTLMFVPSMVIAALLRALKGG